MRHGFEREELARAVELAGELFVDYHATLEERRVAPSVERDALLASFRGTLGEEGVGLERALTEFREQVLPHSMATSHPRYAGLINSSPLPGGSLADLLVSCLNNNSGAFHQAPAMSALEDEVLRSFGALFGWPAAHGMVLPGGSFANLQGILLARARHFPAWRKEGVDARVRPRLYTCTGHHFSIARAAQVIGLGEDSVVAVPGGVRGELDPSALAAAIARDRAEGATPFAVVATLGTTGTGAMDPVDEMADVAAREGLWLHVDACYGGPAALLAELADAVRAAARADSIATDPHKWCFVPMTAALLLTRHPDAERAAFGLEASYIPGAASDSYQRGLATSRRSSSLAVWMALRAHGWSTVRAAVRRNVDGARALEDALAGRGFRVLPGGRLSIACARFEPVGHAAHDLDALQERIARAAVDSGRTWFTTVRHEGATWLRLCLVNLYTDAGHVAELAELVGTLASAEAARA